jgi:tRNA (guanine10-N2)-dimethyltransferase
MVLGAKKNLAHFHITAEGLVLADARKLPFTKVDLVVTDPPYGRSASTLKSTTKQLVTEVLASSWQLLDVGQRICIALPIRGNEQGQANRLAEELEGYIQSLGLKTIESHRVYIHRTLTREIMVYEKTNLSGVDLANRHKQAIESQLS